MSVDPIHIKKQIKDKKLTGQIVMAMCGYKEIGVVNWNRYLREHELPLKVAEFLVSIGLTLHET